MGVRRQARESALQALFMCDFVSDFSRQRVELCFEHFAIPEAAREFALLLCDGVFSNLTKIDERLTCASENWSLSRMARVDRSLLRLATYEIVFLDEVPVNVAINEAIEVAKRFGSEESPVFVNGVLDKVATLVRRTDTTPEDGLSAQVEVLVDSLSNEGVEVEPGSIEEKPFLPKSS